MILCPDCKAPLRSNATSCLVCGFEADTVDGYVAWAPDLAHAGGGFKAESFEHLAELESSSFWFRARSALIEWAVRRFAPSFSSLLEVGCGTGYVLGSLQRAFPGARLVGSEIFVAGLHHAAKRLPGVELVQMDARRIPHTEEFDVVAALDVIEHIAEDEQVLGQLFQAVRPGGIALLSVPQHQWLWSQADDYACHVRRYSASELHGKIEAAGFAIELTTSFVSILLPLMLASRVTNRTESEFDPRKEFQIPALLNLVLERVMTFERFLIAIGVRFPAGGSRFVVAKRPLETQGKTV